MLLRYSHDSQKADFDQLQKIDVEEEKSRYKADAILEKVSTLLNSGKADDADKLLVKNETLLLASSTPNLYIDTRRSVNRSLGRDPYGDPQIAAMSVRQKACSKDMLEEKCVDLTTQIYTSLEKRDILTAAGIFYRNESLLLKNSYEEAYLTMKKQIVKEYSRKYMK